MRKRTRIKIAFTVIMVGCLAALILVCLSPRPLLKDQASRVPFVPDSVWVCWLNDHELIYPDRLGASPAHFRFNIKTHTRERLPALALLLPRSPVASPDEKWLLWLGYDSKQDKVLVHTVTLDGRRHERWPKGAGTELYWSGDSRYVSTLVSDNQSWYVKAIVWSLDQVGRPRSFTIPRVASWSYGPPMATYDGRLLGYAPPTTRNGREEITLYEAPFTEGARAQTHTMQAPSGAVFYTLVFSPLGDRILWVFRSENGSALMRRLHRLLPGLGGTERFRLSVWVSRYDGAQLREVGLLRNTDEDVFRSPSELQWLPGGRAFTFRDAGAVWVKQLDE